MVGRMRDGIKKIITSIKGQVDLAKKYMREHPTSGGVAQDSSSEKIRSAMDAKEEKESMAIAWLVPAFIIAIIICIDYIHGSHGRNWYGGAKYIAICGLIALYYFLRAKKTKK